MALYDNFVAVWVLLSRVDFISNKTIGVGVACAAVCSSRPAANLVQVLADAKASHE